MTYIDHLMSKETLVNSGKQYYSRADEHLLSLREVEPQIT